MHEIDGDVQSTFRKLSEHCTLSTAPLLEPSNLLSYIISTRINSSVWKGITEEFILH